MKRIILISLFLSLTLSSCIQHMEEVETTMIAGSWAKVDGNNMAYAFLTFDSGYMYEYNPGDEFYLLDNTVWGASFSSLKSLNSSEEQGQLTSFLMFVCLFLLTG